MVRYATLLAHLGAVLLLVPGCDHDLDSVPLPCGRDSGCVDRAAADAASPDASAPDSAADLAGPDASKPDAAKPDASKPDAAKPDAAKPDASKPDAAKPDASKPDAATPDATAKPDAATPDATAKPDATSKQDGAKPTVALLVDDTYGDFIKGKLSDSGAKVYVSKKGNVQLLDRLDLNNDGFLDVVISNYRNGSVFKQNSYIYWGGTGGLAAKAPTELPTVGSGYNVAADLDDDGYPDLVFANMYTGTTYVTNSYVYWGSKTGYSVINVTQLPTNGAQQVSAADLNQDGHLDLVFSNYGKNPATGYTYIYWGTPTGPKIGNYTGVFTPGSSAHAIADLDEDGSLDLVAARYFDGKTTALNSYVYHGQKGTFATSKLLELPTHAATGVSVADLDGDNDLDIVFANNYKTVGTKQDFTHNSFIYWRKNNTYSTGSRQEVPTIGPRDVSVAHLNGDAYLDIVFANRYDYNSSGYNYAVNSYVYWGSKSGTYGTLARKELTTFGATGVLVADWNRDAKMDVLFTNSPDTVKAKANAYIYWGAASASSFPSGSRGELPTGGAYGAMAPDPGSVRDRRPVETFRSRVLDRGAAGTSFKALSWKAKVPQHCSLTLRLRSASSEAAVATATWYGPITSIDFYKTSDTPVNKVHHAHRYLQYEATLTGDTGNTPVLERVEISYFK